VPKIDLPCSLAIDLLYQAGVVSCEQFEGQPDVHIWYAQAHGNIQVLKSLTASLGCQQSFKPESDALKNLGIQASCNGDDWDTGSDLALLFPYKNKQQTLFYMAKAMQRLKTGGRIIMACANIHGAKSYQHALVSLTGHADAKSKSKCRIFSARKTSVYDENLAQQWLQAGEMQQLAGLDLYSQAGLFSWKQADMGSQLLLSHLPKLAGEGMDLCCGYGLLSVYIFQHSPNIQSLQLVDAEWQALRCAQKNTEAWINQCVYHCLDATHDALPNRLDWVVCNPPFHTGQTREVGLGQEIVAKGCQSLKRGGEIWMVANRQLPYEHILGQHLREHHTIIEADGFKIIHGVR